MSLWAWLPLGYLLTVAIETPILLLGLSSQHSPRRKCLASLWLTACTYPVVVLVLPPLAGPHYLWVAETFAPLTEVSLFLWVFPSVRRLRDAVAIIVANLASFAAGWWLFW
jgi:hypothetical protein